MAFEDGAALLEPAQLHECTEPFLPRPDEIMFVKPKPTKEMAARYELDLRYSPSPNWTTYEQVMKLVKTMREDLDPLGCRDFIDVQSFIWCTA